MVGVPPLTHDRLSNLLTKSDYALTVSITVQFYTFFENNREPHDHHSRSHEMRLAKDERLARGTAVQLR